jgi:hypothetical protein
MNKVVESEKIEIGRRQVPIYKLSILFLIIFLGVFLIVFLTWLLKNVTNPEHTISGLGTAMTSIVGIIASIVSIGQLRLSQRAADESERKASEQSQENQTLQNQIKHLEDQLDRVRGDLMGEIKQLRNEVAERKITVLKRAGQTLDDQQIRELIPKDYEINPDHFLVRVREYEAYLDSCEKTATHLEGNIEQLKALAKESGDKAIQKLANKDAIALSELGLDRVGQKHLFYTDIFLYLSIWLKNSIRFDQEMPSMKREIKDRSVYADALEYLRQERINWFSPKDRAGQEILKKYLGLLINQLR